MFKISIITADYDSGWACLFISQVKNFPNLFLLHKMRLIPLKFPTPTHQLNFSLCKEFESTRKKIQHRRAHRVNGATSTHIASSFLFFFFLLINIYIIFSLTLSLKNFQHYFICAELRGVEGFFFSSFSLRKHTTYKEQKKEIVSMCSYMCKI